MSDTTFLITGGFFDAVDSDRLYSADQMNQPYKKLIHDGIKKEADGTTPGFAVSASGGMNIAVATGDAIVGGKWAENKDVQTIEIAGNTSGSARVDSIILQCDKSKEVRAIQIVYRQGTTTAPDLVNNEDITELRIANITVPAAASAIVSENITDTRGGAECPWVHSVFDAPDARYIVEEYTGTELAGAHQSVKSAVDSIRYAAQSGQPEIALQVADMSDTGKVYLYQGTETGYDAGYLYYYSDAAGAWIRGAQYGASVVDAALDADSENPVQNKAVTAAVAELNERLDELEQTGGSGANVPTEVRQALYRLLNNNAFSSDAGFTSDIAVLQSWATEVTDITISQSAISISGPVTSQLTAVTSPAGGLVTWTSSDASVATVSSSGLVTGVGNGTAKITASCGGKKAVCAVTVTGFASLTGITATYTQSGTVYAGGDLDNLKSDLVVTGTYSDSTTKTLTDYTLSGTLAVGTSTITAHYGGFTATFNVTVSSAPPLYTLKQGSTSMSSGNSLTLSDGNHCAAVTTSNARMAYVDQTKSSSGAPQNFTTTIFTLSPGDEWEFKVRNIEFTSNTSAENRFNVWLYNLDTATDVNTGQIAYSELTPGTLADVTATGTVETVTNVTSVRFYFHKACEMEYDFEFYVNGVRYL